MQRARRPSGGGVRGRETGAFACFLVLVALCPASLSAGVPTPHLIPLQGHAADVSGVPVLAGDLEIRIFDAATGGTLVFDSGVDFQGAVSKGRFDVLLGSITALALDNSLLYHMEIEIAGDEVLGDANGGRFAFYPGGGSHARTDLEARLTALENEVGSPAPIHGLAARTSAFTDSSASYRLSYGLLGVGRAQGNSAGYRLEGNLLLQPGGRFESASHVLGLGPWYVGEVEDSLAVLSHPDSLRPGDGGTIVLEVLDALGARIAGVGAKVALTSFAGISASSGAVSENPDTTYNLPFTTSATGPDTLVITVTPATSALRDTLLLQSTWFPSEVRLEPAGPTLIQAGKSLTLTAEIRESGGARVPDEGTPLGLAFVSGSGSLGPAVPEPDTSKTILFTAGLLPDTVRIEAHDPEASTQPRDTVTVVVTDRALITSVLDIGNDQGRQVRVIWDRDLRDQSGASPAITEYVVWRRVDELPSSPGVHVLTLAAFESRRVRPADDPDGPVYLAEAGALWEPVGPRVPAMLWETYASVVPTLADSTISQGLHWSVFFVSAHTSNPQVYFASVPDSGYSLDNLAPAAPAGLAMSGAGLLTWEEAPEADFDFFTIYGGNSGTFDGSAAVLGHSTAPDFDTDGQGYAHYFVTATDFSGNEGDAAGIETAVGVPDDNDLPRTRVLLPAHPNPFRRTSLIEFELPAAEVVELRIYDVRGRAVATLVAGPRPAGRHSVVWEGRDDVGRAMPGGIYFCRLEAGSFVRTRSLVRLP